MQIFVSEYLTSGAWDGVLPASLLREGQAMFAAVAADFAALDGCRVVATRDGRLDDAGIADLARTARFVAKTVATPGQERDAFLTLAAESDATFVIAPEFDGLLAARCRMVRQAGGTLLGPSIETIELCSDKLATFEHLRQAGLPSIETAACNFDPLPAGAFPAVVKPRDGAGSELTFLVQNSQDLAAAAAAFAAAGGRPAVRQPYVEGTAASVGVIGHGRGGPTDIFPAGEQVLSRDGRFRYLGGRIPLGRDVQPAIEQLVQDACRCLPDAAGYLGFDLIVPHASPRQPQIVEINPRLTTSYLGYRAVACENLARRLLLSKASLGKLRWGPAVVEFGADGSLGRPVSS